MVTSEPVTLTPTSLTLTQVTWVVMERSSKVTQATLDKFFMATSNPKPTRIRRTLAGRGPDEPISKFGNLRPLGLNKGPVYVNSAESISQVSEVTLILSPSLTLALTLALMSALQNPSVGQ